MWIDVQHICNFGTMQTSQLVTVGPQHLQLNNSVKATISFHQYDNSAYSHRSTFEYVLVSSDMVRTSFLERKFCDPSRNRNYPKNSQKEAIKHCKESTRDNFQKITCTTRCIPVSKISTSRYHHSFILSPIIMIQNYTMYWLIYMCAFGSRVIINLYSEHRFNMNI